MKKIEPEFWQSILEITQIPNKDGNHNNNYSWLSNPFGDNRVYGVKYSISDENFTWEFFLRSESKEEAVIDGNSLLAYLMEIYPGINGQVHIRPITDVLLNKRKVIYELVIPPPNFKKKIYLIKKIINLFNINKNHMIQ
ncbi:hypothetical protein LCGC14_3158880, partial [marine sediment metagenome]